MPTKNVLVIGAHLDDCEYGAGGLCLKFAQIGYKVFFLNTVGDNTNWSTIGKKKQEIFRQEAIEAGSILGAEKIIFDYCHYAFTLNDYEFKKKIAQVVREVNPEIALTDWPRDRHYDHKATGLNSFHALSCASNFSEEELDNTGIHEIYAYEASPSQTISFRPDFYIDISNEIEKICESLSAFRSLGEDGVRGMIEAKKSIGQLRAAEYGKGEYAEGYIFLRWRKEISILPQLLGDSFTASVYPKGSDNYM